MLQRNFAGRVKNSDSVFKSSAVRQVRELLFRDWFSEFCASAEVKWVEVDTIEIQYVGRLVSKLREEEQRWDNSFARSPDLLAKLVAEAMAEYRAGKTQELDPETL